MTSFGCLVKTAGADLPNARCQAKLGRQALIRHDPPRLASMDIQTAFKCFIQLEKIKTGILWGQELAQQWTTLPPNEQPGAARLLYTMLAQIDREVALVRRIYSDSQWTQVGKALDMAAVMISSGVPQEAAFHLRRALQVLMNPAEQVAQVLRQRGLL